VATNTLELMNPAFARMHGWRVAELLGRPLLELFAPAVRAEVREQVRRGDAMGRYRYESVHLRKDGSEFPVLVDVTVVRDAEGQPRYRVVNVQDISELRRGEEAVRRAKRFFEAIFESAAMGMAVLAADGRVLRVNSALCGLLGCAPAALLGSDLRERLGDESRTSFGAALQRVCADAGTGVERLEASMHGDGRRVLWAALALSRVPARNGEETQVIVQAVDITERRQAELALGESRQELRALAAYDAALIEEERKHIAREVHDELGQLLTALRMDLALLRPAVQGEAAQAQLEKMREMIDHTIMVVRHVASNLRPAALDLGLVAALEWLTEDFSLRWEMPCELQVRGEGFALDEAVATALFRVVQESLTNVARHAQAGRVAVRLARDERDLVLEVEDDGQGFDPRALRSRKRKGFGLLGMEERMLKIGGTLEVQSGPWGTRVRLQLPIDATTTATTR
jgi:PAS domain S-box-containing protein